MAVHVLGAGLAGCEAAWQLAKRGISVKLYDVKPNKVEAAYHMKEFGELVCSNSLKADRLENAAGLLKQEMRMLDSLVISAADIHKVPAGGALAVDRTAFAREITRRIEALDNIEIICSEVTHIPRGEHCIVATGPLTDGELAEDIASLMGQEQLFFYDASAPLIAADSIDREKVYAKSRYDKGEADYLNAPMDEEEYRAFYEALLQAETVARKENEPLTLFEGCMPVEEMAKRGYLTLAYGMMKPMGLNDPRTNKRPFAVVQLRMDDKDARVYNLVGFQTNLKFPEQKRVFSMIPGLEQAEFLRYGVMHRNTFIHAPGHLNEQYQMKAYPNIFFAGQITGVEGYIESASSGLVAGLSMAKLLQGNEMPLFPTSTATGALCAHVANYVGKDYQPMSINYGIIDALDYRERNKKERYLAVSKRAITVMQEIKQQFEL
ncbi:methylenetetrahydrofolate--tRNA-(uracil(54)-C(5))-methyltransferase (FADH(2)-oxidizing) TrmFO [Clostridia bacterium OttesenSCG-928-F22]|nr:methylenetetrahydrofolate--tRNA-(uracil(54)-C(5))-methyltransferase (FADH(2)-oxidizing) TrmFO [Clostridia bacterium OttesenSCG-928-F22]